MKTHPETSLTYLGKVSILISITFKNPNAYLEVIIPFTIAMQSPIEVLQNQIDISYK